MGAILSLFIMFSTQNVHLEDYFKKVFVAYIDHPPVYMLPPQRNDNVPSNDMLPVVDSVEMHCYDKDICAIVSGTNLWFAESVKVYEVTTQLCIRENTGLQFQFQMNREKIERQGFLLKKHPEKISLQLETAFDDAVVRSVPVEIKVGCIIRTYFKKPVTVYIQVNKKHLQK